jgi:hypothetical protein
MRLERKSSVETIISVPIAVKIVIAVSRSTSIILPLSLEAALIPSVTSKPFVIVVMRKYTVTQFLHQIRMNINIYYVKIVSKHPGLNVQIARERYDYKNMELNVFIVGIECC